MVAMTTHTELGTLARQMHAQRNFGVANRAGHMHMHKLAQQMPGNGIAQW